MLCSPLPEPSSGENLAAHWFLTGINRPEEPGSSRPRSPGGFGAQGRGQSIADHQQPPTMPARSLLPCTAPRGAAELLRPGTPRLLLGRSS